MIQKNLLFNKIFFLFLMITLAGATVSNISYAVEPEEFLKDPKQELRARDISKNVRCLVCQNQSIDESSAPLAKDLRMTIRNKITEGLTDKEIYKFLTDRYGDFILLNPPLKSSTMILWTLPFVLFFIALFVLYQHNKNSKLR
ncbi:MAG TPA: cytochrome c-type biogenesis protein [Alphaproteobacteria bacterium]|jgi:cytochrome c-type biogenesis protein CcmH|nr:cytochrome c-type biogenesis protein CcmH [Alphaproteobacteria bacterium]HJL58559.1 cytochrome c-type biogenesis protein [Alphaproteobacteria bacterium]HJO14327.1 cytochrome c-type biogenesis protein [Alphaproteobacteria bacterium]|tara:strand:+ start:1430 stop:1858 length:429 start_codon:yes stop_codon:yes gene_type:complete